MTVQKTLLALTLGTLGAIAPALTALADPALEAEMRVGDNNTFSTRTVLPAGSTHVLGELSYGVDSATGPSYTFTGRLTPEGVDTYTIPDLPAGEPFYAWIDNSNSGVDTVMGIFDGNTLLTTDDDGSPVGLGLASGTGGTVNSNGTIDIRISGFPDFDFDGMYDAPPEFSFDDPSLSSDFEPFEPSGSYDLYVQLGTSDLTAADPASADYTFTQEIIPGEVNGTVLTDLPPNESYVVWINNNASGVDTLLGVFEGEELLDFNDDSSPFGNGLGSAITGTVNSDGSLDLRITGFPDFDFNGDYSDGGPPMTGLMPEFVPPTGGHGAEGDYELNVQLGIEAIPGDVDFLSFPDLIPGSEFVAEVTLANFDPIMGWFDSEGTLITVDDDGGENVYPRLVGTVPSNGVVNLAISGFGDFDFTGTHTSISDYVMTFSASEP